MQIVDTENGGALTGNPFGYTGKIRFVEQKYYLKVSGSLHHYFNDVLMKNSLKNTNDFNLSKVIYSLDELEQVVSRPWVDSRLTQLEFGLNLITDKPVDEILRTIKLHKRNEPTSQECNSGRCSKFFGYEDYTIKIYNKAKHAKIGNHILRFEVRLKSDKLRKMGLYTPEDIKDATNLKKVFDFLLACLDHLTIVETISNVDGISIEELILLSSGISATYWEELRDLNSRPTILKRYKKFNGIVKKYGLDENKTLLKTELNRKFDELINSL